MKSIEGTAIQREWDLEQSALTKVCRADEVQAGRTWKEGAMCFSWQAVSIHLWPDDMYAPDHGGDWREKALMIRCGCNDKIYC